MTEAKEALESLCEEALVAHVPTVLRKKYESLVRSCYQDILKALEDLTTANKRIEELEREKLSLRDQLNVAVATGRELKSDLSKSQKWILQQTKDLAKSRERKKRLKELSKALVSTLRVFNRFHVAKCDS